MDDVTSAAPAASDASGNVASVPVEESCPVAVIGSGPAGVRVAQELLGYGFPVVLFNAERWQPYNRVKLTPFLAGEVQIGQVYQPVEFPADAGIRVYSGCRITAIDRETRTVVGPKGRRWKYSRLVIATGSRPHVPNIPGADLGNVFTFRDFDDVEKLVARTVRARRVVVIGGGLLGLEAARGMASHGAEVTVVEHEPNLMVQQLDREAGALLAEEIEKLGIAVRVSCRVKQIEGDLVVERVIVTPGDGGEDETIAADTVIFCTGIRSNIEIARDAGLTVGRGIQVNDRMQTSDPDIYAIGECAEHDGHVYGLVSPGLEQASVAAASIADQARSYAGSVPTTKLKIVGVDVFSMGEVAQAEQNRDVRLLTYRSAEGRYRRLILRRGRLVGGIGVGPWPEINRIQQKILLRERIPLWRRRRFRRSGRLWGDAGVVPVSAWPEAATVCNCTGVTRGRLSAAIDGGCATLEALQRETCASTVCGTCRPLLQELLGGKVEHKPVGWVRTLLTVSGLGMLVALATALLPVWPTSTSVQAPLRLDVMWIDGFWKQVSGFTLLGLAVLAGILSLRKRVRWLRFGGYDGWRMIHGILGASVLAVLFVHTGFHLGSNLNLWLMLCMLATASIGGIAGIVTAVEHRLLAREGANAQSPPRTIPVWLHILAVWPLPLLLGIHILTVYFY